MLSGDVYNGLVMRFAWRVLPLRDAAEKPGIGATPFHASGGADFLQGAGSSFSTSVFLDHSQTNTDEPHRASGI